MLRFARAAAVLALAGAALPAAAALSAGAVLSGCAARAVPYSFASPMLAAADVPPPSLPRPSAGRPAPARDDLSNIEVRPTYVPSSSTTAFASGSGPSGASGGRPADAMPSEEHVRSVSLGPLTPASEAAADAVVRDSSAHGLAVTQLPAPHRAASPLAPSAELPDLQRPTDLRKLVGHRDGRSPIPLAIWWANALGKHITATDGPSLVAAAESAGTLRPPTDDANPGDLLVFDHVESDTIADCVAIAIARDARNVTEFIYLSGGVVRRGFVDTHHASQRRDAAGDILNTFMRTGRRWPPKGTHYLSGELLAHIIRAR